MINPILAQNNKEEVLMFYYKCKLEIVLDSKKAWMTRKEDLFDKRFLLTLGSRRRQLGYRKVKQVGATRNHSTKAHSSSRLLTFTASDDQLSIVRIPMLIIWQRNSPDNTLCCGNRMIESLAWNVE